MSESKSLLARLLAKENITVKHGNYTTAYFDVQNRVLGLPLWRDDDKDLYDMLVGHEVGHALFTPPEGWESAQSKDNDNRVPGDYLNVVEDIRIERMIQSTYPGIVRCFKKGYSYLNESDFFGIGDRDVDAMSLMDRINLKAKLRDLVEIEFSDVEMPLVKKAFAAKTWDEVVEVSRELYEFVKSNSKSQSQENQQAVEDKYNSNSEDNDEEQQIDPSPSNEKEDENDEEDDQQDTTSDSNNSDSNSDKLTESGSDKGGDAEEEEDDSQPEQVETQQNARRNAEDLLETNNQGGVPLVINGFSREQMRSIIVPFSKVRESRERRRRDEIEHMKRVYGSESSSTKQFLDSINNDSQYKEFLAETKRAVGVMVKEFELRKAAYQYSRSSSSRSGALDLERLHEYKINDDIFRRVTTLADAKSHGMVMLIDNSASMSQARGPVITQVLNLAMFCKRTNIPFDVYSFTNGSLDNDNKESGDLRSDHVILTHVLSSSFSRSDYEVAYRQLYDIAHNVSVSEGLYDEMSGTPLNDILTGMHIVLKDFKRRHQVQKPIFTLLTDGDSTTLSVNREVLERFRENASANGASSLNTHRSGIRILLDESKRVVDPKTNRHRIASTSVTTSLLEAIRKEVPGLAIVGYFVANTSDEFSRSVTRASGGEVDNDIYSTIREARKIANKNKFVSYDDVLGYDRYFILKATRASSLDATDDEFEISDKAKRGEITRAFKKYAKSKKGNRVLATQFAEIVS